MAYYYFVKIPRGIRVAEAKNLIKNACDCQIKNAAAYCFFVKVESGNLDSLTTKTYENGDTFIVEHAKSVDDNNWDTMRMPAFFRNKFSRNNAIRGQRRGPEFKAFAIIKDKNAFKQQLRKLGIKYVRIDDLEGKQHSFIIFETLEQAKDAVKTWKENRHESAYLKQYIPYHIRKSFK